MAINNPAAESDPAASLAQFMQQHPPLTVLSGAGCSTASGIPDYRDDEGNWKQQKPMLYQEFVNRADSRQRYWARSFSGWQKFAAATPNAAHAALAKLEAGGFVECVVTQNVDNLHRTAGSTNVIDLHGALRRVRCLTCGNVSSRRELQLRLEQENPHWQAQVSAIAPDGDAQVSRRDYADFIVPACSHCDGILKPDVVFFGEPIPAERIRRARRQMKNSTALLIVGSSLMVFSGYRFAREANEAHMPIAILNRGATRADTLAKIRLVGECADILSRAVEILTNQGASEYNSR